MTDHDHKHQNQRDAPLDAEETSEESMESLRADRDNLTARLQRLAADYQNYQKRVQRDIASAREFANEDLVKSLLSVLDDMERALDAARVNHEPNDPLLEGMQLVHDKILATLGQFGLTVIQAEGKPFDPDLHAAMMQEPSDQVEPQTVVRELQTGYQLKGRTIRPAGVVVSTASEDGSSGSESDR